MKHLTVIFSNAGDEDCQTLRNLWDGFDNVNLIEVTSYNISDEIINNVKQAISSEEDFLIFCGHGSPTGLFAPGFSGYLFTNDDIHLVKAKNVLCIWCYAKSFCEKNNFKCLTSSMYISNKFEAMYNGYPGINQSYINETNNHTFKEMNSMIKQSIDIDKWPSLLLETLDKNNKIDTFNRKGMVFIDDNYLSNKL